MAIIKALSGLAIIGSIGWLISKPDYEPALALITSLTAFVSAFLVDKKQKRRNKQNQDVSNSSMGIQAGRDVKIGSIGSDHHAKQ